MEKIWKREVNESKRDRNTWVLERAPLANRTREYLQNKQHLATSTIAWTQSTTTVSKQKSAHALENYCDKAEKHVTTTRRRDREQRDISARHKNYGREPRKRKTGITQQQLIRWKIPSRTVGGQRHQELGFWLSATFATDYGATRRLLQRNDSHRNATSSAWTKPRSFRWKTKQV